MIIRTIDNIPAYESVIKLSFDNPVGVLKHSTRCSLSSMVKNRLDRADIAYYMILVVESRTVSQTVADWTGVQHESPQFFIFANGELIYHASHSDITADQVIQHLEPVV